MHRVWGQKGVCVGAVIICADTVLPVAMNERREMTDDIGRMRAMV